MKKEQGALFTLLLLGGLLFGLSVADICTPDRVFSEYENRVLAARPAFRMEDLFAGSYTKNYETYVTDQFAGRNTWISVKTATDVFLGKKEINGVYLAKDGTLIEKHLPDSIQEATVLKRLTLLKELKDWQDEQALGSAFHVMLVPTADNILADKLPDYAEYYRQSDLISQVEQAVGDDVVINVTDTLLAHKDEYIYYGTDHHWTTLGAYFAYVEWAERMSVTPVSYRTETVSGSFLGTLHSKTNLPVKPDTIEAYIPEALSSPQEEAAGQQMKVYYDFAEESKASLYEEKYLNTKNQYGYFLDDNHPFVQIDTKTPSPEAAGRSLFVIKDSYANCFIPFLTQHYETIYVLDLRYYNARLFPFLEEWGKEGGMDVLVLYNVIHFIEEFQYY